MRNEKYPDPKEIPPIGNTDLTPKDDAELTGYPDSVKFIHLAMTEDYIETHFDEIIGHESETESRLIKEDCTINNLKQCNRWFIEAFGNAGERVTLIEGDFGEAVTWILKD